MINLTNIIVQKKIPQTTKSFAARMLKKINRQKHVFKRLVLPFGRVITSPTKMVLAGLLKYCQESFQGR